MNDKLNSRRQHERQLVIFKAKIDTGTDLVDCEITNISTGEVKARATLKLERNFLLNNWNWLEFPKIQDLEVLLILLN